MATAQTRTPRYNEQHPPEMEITGYVVLSASSNGTEIKSAVIRSLYLRPRVEEGTLVYGRGDANTCGRFLRCGAEESDAVCLLTQYVESRLTNHSSLEKSTRP
jgi:hypothetical protein